MKQDNIDIKDIDNAQSIKIKPSESSKNKTACFSKLSSIFSCGHKNENNENINLKIFEIIKPYISELKDDTSSDIIKPCINIEYLFHSDIDIISIIKLFYSDYTIFLTGKFLKNSKYLYNFKKRLLTYFNKYNIVYFNYIDKNKIVNLLNIINCFIKNSDNSSKNILISSILGYCNTLNDDYFDSSKKLKPLFFSENIFEPNILYKKIQFSNQEIFISFDSYIIKKMEYKLRTFCQIAEKLGAEKIIIDYTSNKHEITNVDLGLNIFSAGRIGLKSDSSNDNNDDIRIVFEYPNNHSDINLNKYYIIDSILSENEFLITKEEFESDLELKFLIDARCINFIQKYHTNFIINHINKVEQKIFLKAQSYGLNIGNLNLKNSFIKISVNIDFFQIHNNPDIIDGTNIHVLREGFGYLVNIIKKDNKYIKLLRFLQSHLNAIQKKWIYLTYNFDNIDKINKIYHNIINLNFKEDEICEIIKVFFDNNLTWYSFKKFRDLILKGSDDKIEKLYFITYQYHDIMNNKKHIMYEIDKYINDYLDNFTNNFNKLKTTTVKNEHSLSDFGFIKYMSEESITEIPNEIFVKNETDDENILDKFNEIIDSLNRPIEELNNINGNLKRYNTGIPIKNISVEINTEDIILNNTEESPLNKLKQSKSVQFNQNKNEYNIFELPDIDNNNFFIIRDFLIRNRTIIKNIIYMLFQKSFKYIGGLSDNLSNVNKLITLIKNIIVYYFDNDIKNLQLILNNELNNNFHFDLKKKIFEDLVEQLCTDLIKNDKLVLNTNSPSIIQDNNEKETLYKRVQKIFLKTIIKYFDFENKIINITKKLDIKTHNLESELLISYLEDYIPLCKAYKNYNKCKLFYTWDDFMNICEYFNK
jgi:hypothetical protein